MHGLRDRKQFVWRFWPFFRQDDLCAVQYLEEMERLGFSFVSLDLLGLLARFERREGREVRYGISYFDSNYFVEIQEHVDFIQDLGWELVWQWGRQKIFRARDGWEPPPLFTDVETEAAVYRKQLLFPGIALPCVLLAFLAYGWLVIEGNPVAYLLEGPWYFMSGFTQIFFVIFGFISAGVLISGLVCLCRLGGSLLREKAGRRRDAGKNWKRTMAAHRILRVFYLITYACGVIFFALYLRTDRGPLFVSVTVLVIPACLCLAHLIRMQGYCGHPPMKGLRYLGKRRTRILLLVWLLCTGGFFAALQLMPADSILMERRTSNFYMDSIEERNSYTPVVMGECRYHARSEEKAEQVFDAAKRILEQSWGEGHRKATGNENETDSEYLFGGVRLLVKRGQEICIINE